VGLAGLCSPTGGVAGGGSGRHPPSSTAGLLGVGLVGPCSSTGGGVGVGLAGLCSSTAGLLGVGLAGPRTSVSGGWLGWGWFIRGGGAVG
jgi:hypothetical protein